MSHVLHDVEPGSHVAHFYMDDDLLASSVADYAAAGLKGGDAVVLIAEPAHLSAFRDELRGRGVDPDHGPESGIHRLDAEATLGRFMRGGRVVPELFTEVVGGTLSSAATGRAGVRAYGEMVQVLWQQGNVCGALALEEQWNELGRSLPFSLYCSYRGTLVAAGEEGALDASCRLHSAVIADGQLAPRSSAVERFVPNPQAPAAARAFVLAALSTGGDAAVAGTAALVVSELATNAVVHGGSSFSVTVCSLARAVRISVRDTSARLPATRISTSSDYSGRGLRIVGTLCREWGTTPRHDGKVVWAELDRAPA